MATAKKEKTEKKQEFVTVNVNLLNIRPKPSKDHSWIMQVGKGTQLQKLGTAEKGAWIRISLPDGRPEGAPEIGYVMSEFVS